MSANGYFIKNGRVLDPANNIDAIANVVVKNGKIESVGGGERATAGQVEVDAAGCIVCPGLIDMHAHVYEHSTSLGVNPDKYCLQRGVTTVVDGGSAGSATLPGLRHYVCQDSETRVLCFLHVAIHGLAGAGCSDPKIFRGGEADHLNAVNEDSCARAVLENPDLVVGVKVRLDKHITDGGRHEEEVLRRALAAAERSQVPLMVHHTNSGVPFQVKGEEKRLSMPGSLRAGDIYTHTYSSVAGVSSIVDENKKMHKGILDARERGVIFDVGHGQGSFSWEVVEAAVKENFFPDVISTDIHSGNFEGPVKDLPSVMSKFLQLGMPLQDIVAAVTSTPATVIGRQDELGSLGVGREADISVLEVVEGREEQALDCHGRARTLDKTIVPRFAFRKGRLVRCEL